MLRNFITYEWFTVFICISLGLIALSKYVYGARFKDFLLVIGNSKYLKIYSRDQKFIDPFDGLLFANLVIALGIFIHVSYSTLINPIDFELFTFLKLLFAIGTIILIKTLIERLIGSLFEIDELIDAYLFQKTTYKNFSGLILLFVNLFLVFTITPSKLSIVVIISTMTLLFLINLTGFITSFRNHQKLLNFNFFYFLLYLCALEIGPYMILYKVIKEYNA